MTENNSQWSAGYSYDANGNLIGKTDARNITTTFDYDGLNRVKLKQYSDSTPDVAYFYDSQTLPSGAPTFDRGTVTGRFVATLYGTVSGGTFSGINGNYLGYDTPGRVVRSRQITDGVSYDFPSYAYDLSDNLVSQTYPTGRVVTSNFDMAGRLASISGQVSGAAPKSYLNSMGYTANGASERMRLGNGRWEHNIFNNRMQPTEIGLGASATDSSMLKLNYDYGTTANNGNVLRQVITVPTIGSATGFTATQHFQYDQLNRLTGAQEVDGGTSTTWQSSGTLWQQKFTYDRYGNRSVDTNNTTSTMIGPNPVISASTNRIIPRSSPVEYYHYDSAGNLDIERYGEILAYDAENKMVQYQGGASQTGGADYLYDGEGRRVKKARAVETLIFVYNIAGQLVAEYTTSTPQNNGTSNLTSDTLGTPRINTSADGSVRARHDYLPFGEELYAGVGNRTDHTGQGYDPALGTTDTSRQRFTGKERDDESKLDYFGARYYASATGRFMGVDPLMASAFAVEPQSWNRYVLVANNPLAFVDDNGEIKRKANGEIKVFGILEGNITVTHPGATGKVFRADKVILQADDGTEIVAFRQFEAVDDRLRFDCHGLSFCGCKVFHRQHGGREDPNGRQLRPN